MRITDNDGHNPTVERLWHTTREKRKSHLQFTDMEFLSDDNNLLPSRAPPNGKVCLSLLQKGLQTPAPLPL